MSSLTQLTTCAKCSQGRGDGPLRVQGSTLPALGGKETEARVNDRDTFEILLILCMYKLGSPYLEETLILRCHTFLLRIVALLLNNTSDVGLVMGHL